MLLAKSLEQNRYSLLIGRGCGRRLCEEKICIVGELAAGNRRELQIFVGSWVVFILKMGITKHQVSKHAPLICAMLGRVSLHRLIGGRAGLLE